MKILPPFAVAVLSLVVSPLGQGQVLLSYWNFNNDSPAYNSGTLGSFNTTAASYGEAYSQTSNSVAGTLRANSANGTLFSGSSIYINFSNLGTISNATINGKTAPGYTTQNITSGNAGYGVFSDSTVNRAGSDATTGGSLLLLNTAGNANGKYITLSLSSVGYATLSLSYATRLTSAVTASQAWSYSLDGINFLSLATLSPTANGNFSAQTLNLSGLSGAVLDNQSSFFLRMTYTSANTQGSQAFDNFQLTGVAVPEPATGALWLGGLGCILISTRRIRRYRQG